MARAEGLQGAEHPPAKPEPLATRARPLRSPGRRHSFLWNRTPQDLGSACRLRAGNGRILINRRPFEDYFPRETLRMVISQPLQLTNTLGQFDAMVNVGGGGPTGQAGAVRHGIARALLQFDDKLRQTLKRAGLLTTGPRMKERKQYASPAPGRSSSTRSGSPPADPAMLKVAVTGASGYMGAELLRLLSVHPKVRIAAVTSERLAGERLDKSYPHLRGLSDLVFQDIDPERLAAESDLVFLALPHMESQRLMPVLRRSGRKAIDLSADYRLKDAALYTTWYKAPHEDAAGLAEAVYGLPELHRKQIAAASLIASPGCYPMGAVLATAPLLQSGRGAVDGIGIDGK
jgi:ribosomal protein S9